MLQSPNDLKNSNKYPYQTHYILSSLNKEIHKGDCGVRANPILINIDFQGGLIPSFVLNDHVEKLYHSKECFIDIQAPQSWLKKTRPRRVFSTLFSSLNDLPSLPHRNQNMPSGSKFVV